MNPLLSRARCWSGVSRRCARGLTTSTGAVGSLAVVFGGFGFTQRQLSKHEQLYGEHGFDVMPVLSSIPQLISPKIAATRGRELAARVREVDSPTVIHMVSGSFWTGMYLLANLEPAWREQNVKAIMFDSCPPKSDVYAFGGWLSWLIQAKANMPTRVSKPLVSHLFHPVRPYFGIDQSWTSENDALMFGSAEAGARARALAYRAGATSAACRELMEAAEATASSAVEDGASEAADAAAVVPRSTNCLFVRGRSDPVLEPQYVDAYYAFLRARTTANVESHLFEKAQHAMAVVEAPEQYKAQHVERLLRQVPEWSK
jgi:hypothetical protein